METYTVVGVWDGDIPIPVGVIKGSHSVSGGYSWRFNGGLWATSVEAADVDDAERVAVQEMRASL